MKNLMDNCKKRKVERFDTGWKFLKGDPEAAHHIDYYDDDWRELDIPHDWSIEGPFDREHPGGPRGAYLPGGIGWYRKKFHVSGEDRHGTCLIQFDGIYKNSKVWINGYFLGERPGGYVSFYYDITPYLNFGKANVIAVRAENLKQPNCRWYSGSGIYRHVWLVKTGDLCVSLWGTYITTRSVSPENATVEVNTQVKNRSGAKANFLLITEVLSPDGEKVDELQTEGNIEEDGTHSFSQTLKIVDPKLWCIESPALYAARTKLMVRNEVVDDYFTAFGIRTATFDPQKGFSLNGESVKMKGVCIHHDAGCLGAAVPDRVLERRLEVLKELGCNAIRTSHNPPAPEMLDMCDRMGFFVIDEAFDKWFAHVGYGEIFETWCRKDLKAMLQRDRNHPSVIIWSVGNEVENQGSEKMKKTLKTLVDYVHENEPSRPVTCALRPPIEEKKSEKLQKILELAEYVDVLCCNYQEMWYEELKAANPGLTIIGTETYHFFRGAGNRFKAFVPRPPWFDVEEHDYVTGQFIWTGIDYLGESRGWPSKGWSSAPIDTCGFLKPRAYYYQSLWNNKPLVRIAVYDDTIERNAEKLHWSWPKIASHWNFPHFEGELARVVTYTNCKEVELFLNGESYGIKKLSEAPERMITWYIPYEPGKVEAVGINGGKPACSYELQTAGAPAAIELEPDRTVIDADGLDVVHVRVKIVDENGVLAPHGESRLSFEIKGPGRIIGLDNGDLASNEPYKTLQRSAYRGQCLAIIQSSRGEGRIEIGVEARGLKGAQTTVITTKDRL